MREFTPPVRSSVGRILLGIILPLVIVVPMGGLVRAVLGMSPTRYRIGDGALVVDSGDWFSGSQSVRLGDVTGARLVALRGGRRVSGTALPGLCAGRFSYPDLGTVWQATSCTGQGVIIEVRGASHPIVISPPDPEAFLQNLRSDSPSSVTLPPPDTSVLRAMALVGGPVALIGALMLFAICFLGPSRMRYRVGDGALEVRTLFGKKRWPTAGARAKGYTPSKLWRVAGTALPGYYTGLYRESGETTRVYGTDLGRVVLFEGPTRVIVSPEDRVGMLRALEEEGVEVEHHA